MKIHYTLDDPGKIRNAVVTTGSFDGVHQGHRVILERLKRLAIESNGESVLITFHPHPRKVLYPDTWGKDLRLITTRYEKERLLAETGLDHLIVIPFNREFAQIESTRFVKEILLGKLHARTIVTGYNHHFGKGREGDTTQMMHLGMEFGFSVVEIPAQEVHHESTSSVIIRQALSEGNIRKANRHLGYAYMITGDYQPQVPDTKTSSIHRFSLRIEDENKLIPPDGVYAVTCVEEEQWITGRCFITNSRNNPRDATIEFRSRSTIRFPLHEPTLFFHHKIQL